MSPWLKVFAIVLATVSTVQSARAETCSRVDLRPALERVGFESIRNRGGRDDGFAFAFSEMLGLSIEQPISARWLEHRLEDRSVTSFKKMQNTARAILAGKLRPCSESSVRSEDIESTRLKRLRLFASASSSLAASGVLPMSVLSVLRLLSTKPFQTISLTPSSCKDSERAPKKAHAAWTLTESRSVDSIDRSLRAHRLALIVLGEGRTYAVAGRRLAPGADRCEYLVRLYEGPACSDEPCEDGARWMDRLTLASALEKVWSLEP